MNNQHKGKPLTNSIAEGIIRTKTYTSGSPITRIAEHVRKIHEENGGLPAKEDLEDIIERSLRYLSQFGEANLLASDSWMIPRLNQKVFGSGKHWVYLYYFSAEKEKAKSDSASPYDDEDILFWAL